MDVFKQSALYSSVHDWQNLCAAYGMSATVANAVAGFAKFRVWPVDQHVLSS